MPEATATRAPAWTPWLAPGALLLSAVVFVLSPATLEVPRPGAADILPGSLSTEPRRSMLGDPPIVHLGGFDRECQDCHFIFNQAEKPGKRLAQHREVRHEHGRNDHCTSCHFQADRNLLLLHGGQTVGFDASDQLCAGCHGTTWRDWDRGIHGRSTGSWDTRSPERGKLTCVQCHDPHHPAFAGLVPLPGPNTLRMGTPSLIEHAPESPLMQGYRGRSAGSEEGH